MFAVTYHPSAMKIKASKDRQDDPTTVDKMMDLTQGSYRSFMDYVAFRDDDPIWMMTYKLFIRFVGIVFFILISPFVLIGFFVAIMVAA